MKLVISPAAAEDAQGQAQFLADRSPEAGRRFLTSFAATLEQLAQMPEMGSPCHFERKEPGGLRMHPVRDFGRHLIFYRPVDNGIFVVRVLHSSQDIQSTFGNK